MGAIQFTCTQGLCQASRVRQGAASRRPSPRLPVTNASYASDVIVVFPSRPRPSLFYTLAPYSSTLASKSNTNVLALVSTWATKACWRGRRVSLTTCRSAEVGTIAEAEVPLEKLLNLDRTEGEALSADEINAAHQQMLAKGLDTPYSSAAIIGRANVLDGARDALLGGSSSYELAWHIDSPNAGGYLALLTEVGEHRLAIQLGNGLLAGVKPVDADCKVAMAMAHCALARDLEAGEEGSSAYVSLETAYTLLVSSGGSDMSTSLVGAIQESMQTLRPFFALDQLKLRNVDGSGVASRKQLIQFVREGLDHDGGEAFTSSYARAVLNELTAEEVVCLAKDWIPDTLRGRVWWYSGLVEQVAAAHVALGFAERSPYLVERGMLFCTEEEDSAAKACQAVCLILLGKVDRAFGILTDANISPWDRVSHMGIMGMNGARKLDGGMKGERGEGSTVILEDKKSYMYMFTKRWLRDVAFPRFRTCARMKGISFSLIAYFTSLSVQMYLIMSSRRILSTIMSGITRFIVSKVSPVYGRMQQLFRPQSSGPSVAYPLLSKSAFERMRRRSDSSTARWPRSLLWLACAAALSAALLSTLYLRNVCVQPSFSAFSIPSPASFLSRQTETQDGSIWRIDTDICSDHEALPFAEKAVEALRIWQHVKNEALGSSRDSERLDEVLCGAELGMWRRRMRKMVISELSWRYETRRVEVQQVTMLNTMRARSLRVMAAVYERATLCDPSGPLPHHSYQTAYRMEFMLKEVQGTWKVCKSRVVA